MVSAVLLLVLALATLPIVEKSGTRAGADRSRSVAASIGEADQARMRQLPVASLANLRATTTKTVDGVTYTVVSRSDYVRDNGGYVSCTDNSTARTEYLKIRSTITWPRMNGTQPVVLDSLVSPGISGLDPAKGALTFKVLNEAGAAVPGVAVTAAGLSDTTDSGGCAIFTQIPAGAQPVTWSLPGYVTQAGASSGSDTVTIVGQQTTIYSTAYDRAASVTATPYDISSPSLPSAWPVFSFRSGSYTTQLPTNPFVAVAATTAVSSTTASNLYPFAGGYGVWAGNCTGNEPATSTFSAYPNMNATPAPGGSATAVPRLRETKITMTRASQTTPFFYSLKPTTSAAGMNSPFGCGPAISRASTGVAVSANKATLSIDTPPGAWTICIDDNRNGAGSGTYRFQTINVFTGPTVTSNATVTNSPLTYTMPASGNGSTAASGAVPATTWNSGVCT